ncbi:hypothetical protein Barb6XT_02571 [Bacteroidales bacterium Barb6XT]|nr:hypothetical protein Barb6XT_02571 [Bacteroidales bacterium Barb6XT]
MMKKQLFACVLLFALTACGQEETVKQDQTISFDKLPAQTSMAEGSLQLTATASSGLLVSFASSDESIAAIERGRAAFRQPGIVSVTASQPGSERFYEATNVTQTFEILSAGPTKKEQTISFDLASSWKSSSGNIVLKATASSGLPVVFTSSDETVGLVGSNYLVPAHYYESKGERAYTKRIGVTASQAGNAEYNPAANVTRLIDITVDVKH